MIPPLHFQQNSDWFVEGSTNQNLTNIRSVLTWFNVLFLNRSYLLPFSEDFTFRTPGDGWCGIT